MNRRIPHLQGLEDFVSGVRSTSCTEHEIERYLKEPIENPRQDPVAFHKTFPIISRIARDYFAASAISAPAEALSSRMGDTISKKRSKLSPRRIRMLSFLRSRGIILEEEIPQDNADTEDDVDQSIELTDEQGDAGVEDWLVVDDDDDDDEVTVDTSTATQVFES